MTSDEIGKCHVGNKWLAVIILAGVAGAFLTLWPFMDARQLSWIRAHLTVIQSQMEQLSSYLQEFNEANGRYPDNNEGLGALTNFEARFTLTYAVDPEDRRSNSIRFPPYYSGDRWHGANWALVEYRATHGHVPRSQEEFRNASMGLSLLGEQPAITNELTAEVEIAIGRADDIFIMSPAGILTPWLLPYAYENRRGLDAGLFKDSPANKDRNGDYSIRVDDGIYIYSFGAMSFAREYRIDWWWRYGPRFAGAALMLFSVVLGCLCRYWSGRRVFFISGVIASVGSLFFGGAAAVVTQVTCYVMSPLFHRRDPEAIRQQIALLEKYRRNGIISDDTYKRTLAAIPDPERD